MDRILKSTSASEYLIYASFESGSCWGGEGGLWEVGRCLVLEYIKPVEARAKQMFVCKILKTWYRIHTYLYNALAGVVVGHFFRQPGKNLILNGLLGEQLSSLFLNESRQNHQKVFDNLMQPRFLWMNLKRALKLVMVYFLINGVNYNLYYKCKLAITLTIWPKTWTILPHCAWLVGNVAEPKYSL